MESDRSVARSFDRIAEIYERARPGWPWEAVDCAIERLGLDRETTVLDLGAGTGKLTRMLVERSDDVVAVEPLDGMRIVLETLVRRRHRWLKLRRASLFATAL